MVPAVLHYDVRFVPGARLAFSGDGRATVSLDEAGTTVRDAGRDTGIPYTETSRSGLAVDVVEC